MHADPSRIATLTIDPHALTVACPRRHATKPFDECRGCEHCWLVHVGDGPGSSFVICESLPPEVPRRAGASMPEARITPVTAIMTPEVITVHAGLAIERLILLLIDEDIGGAPVVDDQGRLIGMVSRDDLVTDDYDWADLRDDFLSYPRSAPASEEDGVFLPELLRSRTVADLMNTRLVTLSATSSVAQAAAALDQNRVHELVVIDPAGAVAGVVSKSDIVRWIGAAAGAE